MAPNVHCSLSIFILEYLNMNWVINRALLKTLVITKLASATKMLIPKYVGKNLALPNEWTGYWPLLLEGNLCHS